MMNLAREFADPLSEEVSRPLTAASGGDSARISRKWWFWTGLLLACFLPRILLSWQMPAYCNDAYFYIHLADQITKGNVGPLIDHFGINVYPLVLVAGHALGFSWPVVGASWGILMGSLTILPLYGWLRRIGNESIALAGCFLYASHPKFIEISVEPIRDPTFWFLFVLTLYFTWRVLEGFKLRWCLAAGAALALAVHTRTEGWLLLIPLLTWLVIGGWESPGRRWKAALGTSALFCMIPLFVALINLTLYRGEPDWQLGKLKHFATCWEWVQSQITEPAPLPVAATAVPAANQPTKQAHQAFPAHAEASVSREPAAAGLEPARQTDGPLLSLILPKRGSRSRTFLQQFHSTLEPLHLLFIFVGLLAARRFVCGRRFLPLVVVAVLVGIAIWIWISHYGVSNGRYFLTAYLALLPLEAFGLMVSMRWVRQYRNALSRTDFSGSCWAGVWLGLVLMVGWGDAFIFKEDIRIDELALVNWLHASPYAKARLAIDPGAKRIGFHFCGEMPPMIDSPWHLPASENQPPQMVIVSKACLAPEQFADYHRYLEACKYRIVSVPDFPNSRHLWVLVHEETPPEIQKPNQVAELPESPHVTVR